MASSWLWRIAGVIVALPFGWLLGVLVARLIIGPEMGVFPVLTIPFGLAAGIAFALSPVMTPPGRIAVMLVGSAAIALLV